MRTISDCVKSRDVFPVPGNLTPRQQPKRVLVASPAVKNWMLTVLPELRTDGHVRGATSPTLQVATLARRFIAGEDFTQPLPHEMHPIGLGIWRLRTHDVRLVGWFPEKCAFIIGSIDAKRYCNTIRDNQMYQEVIQFRKHLNVNGGKYESGEIDDLI